MKRKCCLFTKFYIYFFSLCNHCSPVPLWLSLGLRYGLIIAAIVSDCFRSWCAMYVSLQHHWHCRCWLTSHWRQVFCQRYITWHSLRIFSRASTQWFRHVGQRFSRSSSNASIRSICIRSMEMHHYTHVPGDFNLTGLTAVPFLLDDVSECISCYYLLFLFL